jgi:hypothetical protein
MRGGCSSSCTTFTFSMEKKSDFNISRILNSICSAVMTVVVTSLSGEVSRLEFQVGRETSAR